MKNIVVAFFLIFTLTNCTDSGVENNPYLGDIAVYHTVYLNNSTSINLQFVGGYIVEPGGYKGIVVYRGTSDLYYAFDLACPNSPLGDCSKMTVDGLNMICSCDDSKYALALGGAPQSGTRYGAKEYRVVNNGQTLLITNF
ncbi:hypothetical protein [Aureibaculum luteum]|uniref:hypothetical protein n=1 Tax=Aureibaculum luteum TaxID=1548456 RepID=UPI000E5183EF|nr:hypothetical protein [Aureibaculum luteum]